MYTWNTRKCHSLSCDGKHKNGHVVQSPLTEAALPPLGECLFTEQETIQAFVHATLGDKERELRGTVVFLDAVE